MFRPKILTWILAALLLAGCGSGGPATVAPEVRFTEAAQTAEALRIERFGQTPTVDPAGALATIVAPTPTATPEPTTPPASAALTASPTPGGVPPAGGSGAGPDGATYVSDVTIPDDTVLAPGEAFEKIWRIRNTGSTTWTTEYALIYIDGEQMAADARVPIPNEVSPGEEVDVSIQMTAPKTTGSYFSYWKMSRPDGQVFGFGAAGNEAIWVKINVQGDAAEATAAPTGPASAISSVTLNVDSSLAAACPHTFVFTGQISLTKAASVTYLLEVGDAAGGQAKSPPPATRNLAAGTHPVVFELTFPETMSGWARLRVTSPAETSSGQVNFTLTCG